MTTERISLEASNVVAGEDARALIDELKATNALFAAIDGTQNTHFIVFDLTTIGRASQHRGETKYVLAEAGLEQALPTLISKPLHVTANYDAHFAAKQPPKPIGVFLGSAIIKNADGTSTVRAVASLWKSDFPDEVVEIQTNIATLGASYEVAYPMLAASTEGSVVTISQYEFSGGAILTKAMAAHPETQVLMADTIADKVIDHLTRELGGGTKIPTKAAQGGTIMPKYAGIPDELEPVVDAYVTTAVATATKGLQTAVSDKQKEMDDEKEDAQDKFKKAQADIAALNDAGAVAATDLTATKNQLAEATTKIETLQTELETKSAALTAFETAKVAQDATAKIDATWTKLKADWGLEDTQREKRETLLAKLANAMVPLTPEEFKELVAGGKKASPAAASAKFPLLAGKGEDHEPDEKVIAELMPAAAWHSTPKRALYR